LKNLLRNRARPEGSIVEAYLESETLAFWERFMDNVKTSITRTTICHMMGQHLVRPLFSCMVSSPLARLGQRTSRIKLKSIS
jgi:hypothetical protein